MLSAVQIFNNPNIQFKSETYIVLSIIAWTYLLHAYFKDKKIDYRYYKQGNINKRYDKTKRGAYKYWELEKCLDDNACPLDKVVKTNLKFLIGLRHEIKHQMTDKIDDYLSARLQACCLNYNSSIKNLFGEQYGIDKYLSFSLQFSSIKEEHAGQLREFTDLPKHISAFINDFDDDLSEQDYNDIRYSYRVLYIPKVANRKGQADKVIEFVKADSPEAEQLNKEYVLIKEKEKKKYLPTQVWEEMQQKGYERFGPHQHTQLWKSMQAKDPSKGYGIQVANAWYWYDRWIEEVERHCIASGDRYKT